TIGATELLVGRNDLQEIDVGDNGGRPGQAVVVSQRQVVADKVTGGDAHVFQIQQLVAGNAARLLLRQEVHRHSVRTHDVIVQFELAEPIVVARLNLQYHFFQRHHVLVPPGAEQGQ